jgi:hypothetical protein
MASTSGSIGSLGVVGRFDFGSTEIREITNEDEKPTSTSWADIVEEQEAEQLRIQTEDAEERGRKLFIGGLQLTDLCPVTDRTPEQEHQLQLRLYALYRMLNMASIASNAQSSSLSSSSKHATETTPPETTAVVTPSNQPSVAVIAATTRAAAAALPQSITRIKLCIEHNFAFVVFSSRNRAFAAIRALKNIADRKLLLATQAEHLTQELHFDAHLVAKCLPSATACYCRWPKNYVNSIIRAQTATKTKANRNKAREHKAVVVSRRATGSSSSSSSSRGRGRDTVQQQRVPAQRRLV